MPDELTLTSTTATQEEIHQALGITPEPDPAQPEPKTEESGEVTQPEQQEGKEAEQGTHGKQAARKPKSAQDRINELTREKYELRERLARLEGQVSRGDDKSAAPAKPAPIAVAPTRPKPEQSDPKYQTYEEYIEDLADWRADQRLAADKAAEADRQKNERLREKFDDYNAQKREAAAKHDDWDEVMSNENIKLPEVLAVAIPDFENGAEMVYYIATNDEFRQKLLDLNRTGYNETKIVHELSRLSDHLLEEAKAAEAAEAPAADSTTAAPVVAPKPAVSSAPAPIKPISGASTAANGTKSPDEMTHREYTSWRESRKRRT